VPMILENQDYWDHEAIAELIAYRGSPKQVWDNQNVNGPWMNLMRNNLNTQVYSFKHPDFFAVSATHGPAHLAMYDQATWDKYQLTKLAGPTFATNTFIVEQKAGSADPIKVAKALEDLRYDGGVGEVWMRADDHQVIMPLYVSSFVKAGTADVKYDADDTGYGWKSDVRIDAKENILPTTCRMERP